MNELHRQEGEAFEMKKPAFGRIVNKVGPQINDPWFKEEYPDVYEFLTAQAYDDGSQRRTGTITLFVDTGVLGCFLNDRDNARSAKLEAEDVMALFTLMQEHLKNDTAPWQMNKSYTQGRGNGGQQTPF